ncbi:MAG TPA: hypothetical protein VFW90_00005, partial [Candidatus Saccharimonadales bacterium]|nr:hypothetical protein [Candidatus Saccharimonadales bacterium]
MTEQIPKPVDMHEAFKRYPVKRGAEKIAYVRLHGVAADARMSEPRLFNAFLRSPEGSVDEETFAHWTAVGNLVLTAQQLQRASGELKRIISERFTQMTVELYGKPSAEIAGQLIAEQLNGLEPLVGNNDVDQARLSSTIGFLREQLGDAEISEVPDNNFEDVLEQVGTYIRERFGPILESLWREGEPADKKISAQEVAERFQRGIDMLAEDDPAWKDWHSEVTQDSSAETITRRKFIGVGQNSRAVSSLAVTFTHEAIGHALRSINGGKTGDEKLEHGMPGS